MADRYVVGILGAGRMAQGLDQPGDVHVLTLAHAVCASPGFELGGFYDVDPRKAEAAENKWGCPASPRDRAAWLGQPWDVICIATPDAQHAADLRDVLAARPRAIVVEKPVATDGEEGLRLLEEARRRGIPLIVDFPRRWHSGVAAVAEQIRTGAPGRPRAAIFVYSGDAIHAAVHMLDLFHGWWGGDWAANRDGPGGLVTSLILRRPGDEVAAAFVGLPPESQYVWEMHVYCERGKVELSRSPEVLELSLSGPHPLYPGFQVPTLLKRFAMEDEPLLLRMLDTLASLIGNPETADVAMAREIESQRFIARVLWRLEAAASSAAR